MKKVVFAIILISLIGVTLEKSSARDLSEWLTNAFVVEVVFSNNSRIQLCAIPVSTYLGGTLLVTLNKYIRSTNPDTQPVGVSILYRNDNGQIERYEVGLYEMHTDEFAFIYVDGSVDLSAVFLGCPTYVEPLTKCSILTHSLNYDSMIDLEGVFLAKFQSGIAMVEVVGNRELLLGAPVITDEGIVGVVVDFHYNKARVKSILEIISACRELSLPWYIMPLRACVEITKEKSIEELRIEPNALQGIVFRLFKPGAYYSEILDNLKPDRYDLIMLFGSTNISNAESIYDEIRQNCIGDKVEIFHPTSGDYFKLCNAIEGYRISAWYEMPIITREELIICDVSVGGRDYNGFIFLNDHWIWLPYN